MQTSQRTAPIVLLVVHTNEGPEIESGAQGLADYLQHIDGGYHAIFDDHSTVITAADQTVVWGAGGVNGVSLHGCFIHYSANGWTDRYSQAELAQGAVWFAGKCKQYGIPAARLSPQQVHTQSIKGVCGHVDVSATFPASEGHTDPGPFFPWTHFLQMVQAHIVTPPPKPKVPPMFDPNKHLAARLHNPDGGWWDAYDNGLVDYLAPDGTVVAGGMNSENDLKNFAGHGEHVARLEPRTYGDPPKHGYTIVAQDGHTYVPERQH